MSQHGDLRTNRLELLLALPETFKQFLKLCSRVFERKTAFLYLPLLVFKRGGLFGKLAVEGGVPHIGRKLVPKAVYVFGVVENVVLADGNLTLNSGGGLLAFGNAAAQGVHLNG